MVKRGSKTVSSNMMGETNAKVVEMAKKILAMEKEIGRLRHHVSVLSKRELGLKKKLLRVEKGKEKEEVVESVAERGVAVEEVVVEADGLVPEADAVAESVTGMVSEGSVVPDSVSTGNDSMEVDDGVTGLKDSMSDEDVLVDGRMIPLKRYTRVASGERVRRVEASPPRVPLAMVGRGRGVELVGGSRGYGVGRGHGWSFGTTREWHDRGPG